VIEDYDKAYAENDDLFGATESSLLVEHVDLIPPGCRVLDLGVGQGRNALPLARRGCQVTGIDTSQVAVDFVRAAAEQEDLPLTAILQDFLLYEPDRNFDVVLCFGLMQMLDLAGCASLVERLHHWTRPGGSLFLTAWNVDDPSFDHCCENWERRSVRSFRHPEDGRHCLFLDRGEILKLFFRWEVVHHREGLGKAHRHGKGPTEKHSEVEAVLVRPRK
jgi:cyclopropane fatty-acyl-phospholipid synthase-like methyltransferase